MPYVKRIVCLANSYKTGGTCIAGKEVLADGYGGWIRPVSERAGEELSWMEAEYKRGQRPKLLDVIDVPLLGPAAGRSHETENHRIDVGRKCVRVGQYPIAEVEQLDDEPQTLWTNRGHTFGGTFNCVSAADASAADRSLVLIRPEDSAVRVTADERDGWKRLTYWVRFAYKSVGYVLRLTDPVVIAKVERCEEGEYSLGDVHLCVSLTKIYSGDGRCHKLVAGVIGGRMEEWQRS